ncbi:hypothetical protein FACS189427_06370 [Planctomycetales bacterium]|nr:hypothetical protein FACS189427_06370 [Planctomycetales bacterium]
MFIAPIYCKHQHSDIQIFVILPFADLLTIPLIGGLARETAVRLDMENILTKTIWTIWIAYSFGVLVLILYSLLIVTRFFEHDNTSIFHRITTIIFGLMPLFMFFAHLLSWIAIFFLKHKKEWTLYTIAQTLFIFDNVSNF